VRRLLRFDVTAGLIPTPNISHFKALRPSSRRYCTSCARRHAPLLVAMRAPPATLGPPNHGAHRPVAAHAFPWNAPNPDVLFSRL
jgi:hypothetical protein